MEQMVKPSFGDHLPGTIQKTKSSPALSHWSQTMSKLIISWRYCELLFMAESSTSLCRPVFWSIQLLSL